MNRHAYLIMAHDNLYVLTKTIQLLDDVRNDIFIHCDIKMGDLTKWKNEMESLVKKSSLIFVERENIYWGSWSQTNMILRLLEAGNTRGGV